MEYVEEDLKDGKRLYYLLRALNLEPQIPFESPKDDEEKVVLL